MVALRLRHYQARLRWSERLRYRVARVLIWAIPVTLVIAALSYLVAGRA